MKTTIIYQFLAIMFFGLTLVSCNKDGGLFTPAQNEISIVQNNQAATLKSASATIFFGTPVVVPIMAGQNIEVGSITVGNDATNVYVIFKTSGDWSIGQTHLYVGTKALCPVNKPGAPQIGLFPYATTHNPTVKEFTYTIPRSSLPNTFIVAAHAEVHRVVNGVVVQSETAWGKGTSFVEKGTWAMYFNHTIQEKKCTFIPVVFDYIGGQTILTGNLIVTNDEKNLYVSYNTNTNWYLNAVHLYVGTLQNLPINNSSTPIPGKFPYIVSFSSLQTSHTVTLPLSNLPKCYIIAAHAELVQKVGGVVISTETGWSAGTQFPNTNRWGFYSSYCTQYCD